MSDTGLKNGENFRVLAKIEAGEEAEQLKQLMNMSSEERSQFYLEKALEDIVAAVEDCPDSTVVPLVPVDRYDGCVVLQAEHLKRWVQILLNIPDYFLNDGLTALLCDMISTTDVEGNRLDLMPDESSHLCLVPQH